MTNSRSVQSLCCTLATNFVLLLACFIEAVVSSTCYRDESLGDREGNVYYCQSKDLPRCCTKDGLQTCCVSEDEKNLTEQLQLWGTVAGVILLIAILFVCCKKDISCCNSEGSLRERWHSFRHKDKNKEAHLVEKDENIRGTYYDNPVGGFGGSSSLYPPKDPYNFPPLPPAEKVKNVNDFSHSYA